MPAASGGQISFVPLFFLFHANRFAGFVWGLCPAAIFHKTTKEGGLGPLPSLNIQRV